MKVKRNEVTAELVGLSFGDGGLTPRKGTRKMRFQLKGHLVEDREHYDNYILPLFNKEIMISTLFSLFWLNLKFLPNLFTLPSASKNPAKKAPFS